MYNFTNFYRMVQKNFVQDIMGGMGISVQFGVFTEDNQEKTIVLDEFGDAYSDFFLSTSRDLVMNENTVFSYFVTIGFLKEQDNVTEILFITCSDTTGASAESSFKLIRDYRQRITQIKPIKLDKVIFKDYAEITHRENAAA